MDLRFSKEQEELRKRMRKFAEEKLKPHAMEWEEKEEFPPELIRLLRQEDIFKYLFPKEYGGAGISSVNICIIREELSRVCVEAEMLPVMQGLGSYPITLYGSEEQKRKYFPPLVKGEKFISFCLTEPGAGSDVAGLESTARLDGDSYILNGTKIYVAHPQYAEVFTVFAKTAPELKGKGISAFIVEKGFPGIKFEKMHLMPAQPVGRMIMVNCRVPKENLLGPLNRGMRVALSNLDVFRTTVGATVIGMAQSALEEATQFAKGRVAFERPIVELQAIQFKLADMATQVEAARLLVYRAAWMKDQGLEVIKEASMAKYFATEIAQKVADEAVQILGGRGIWQENRVSFLYKAVRPPRIYEGTSEIQKIVIARELLKGKPWEGPGVVGNF